MIIHELATNAAKYGAFSTAEGRLEVSCREDGGEVELVWTERGGPPAIAPTRDGGFGSVMSERMIKQIGGSITHDWQDEGLVVTLKMSKARLGA